MRCWCHGRGCRRLEREEGEGALRFPYHLKRLQPELAPDAAFLRLAALVRRQAGLDPDAYATEPRVIPSPELPLASSPPPDPAPLPPPPLPSSLSP